MPINYRFYLGNGDDYMEFHAYENGKVVELDPKEKQGYIDYVQKNNMKI